MCHELCNSDLEAGDCAAWAAMLSRWMAFAQDEPVAGFGGQINASTHEVPAALASAAAASKIPSLVFDLWSTSNCGPSFAAWGFY